MPLPQDVIDSIAQSILNDLLAMDRLIQERLDNFWSLASQVADSTEPAWLGFWYVDAKLKERGLLQQVDDAGEGTEVYMRIADRVAELSAPGQRPAIPPVPAET